MIQSSNAAFAASISPELELLLCSARTELTESTRTRIRALLGGALDWNEVMRLAQRHRVRQLLFHQLSAVDPGAVPEPVLAHLATFSRVRTGRSRFVAAELVELTGALEERGVPVVPLKGAVLAATVYGDLRLREFSDIDLLLHPRHVGAASELLRSRGYAPLGHLTASQEAAFRRYEYARPFESGQHRINVDVHWKLTRKYFALPIDIDRLWSRSLPVAFNGATVRGFPPEDQLLILCVHGAKHGPFAWPQLRWVCDVAELVRANPSLDWERLLERLRASGLLRVVLLGLLLANRLLETPLAAGVRRVVERDPVIAGLADEVAARLLAPPGAPLDGGLMARTRFELSLKERRRDQLRYCVARATTPTHLDWTSVELPPRFAGLYTAVRLARLMKYLVFPWRLRAHMRRPEASWTA